MKNRLLFFILILSFSLLLTGCWDYREIDDLSIVTCVAIDKADSGKYLLSIEIADMKSKGKESELTSVIVEIEGETFFDAIRNAISVKSPRLYWGHMTSIILGQEVAREGVTDIIDFVSRDAEFRTSMYVLVSREGTAREIMNAKGISHELRAQEIEQILDDEKSLSKTLNIKTYDFIKALGREGNSGIMSAICLTEIKGEKIIKLCGTSVFKEDKLIGFLTEEETKSLGFVLDKIEGGLIPMIISTNTGGKEVTLEIRKSKTTVKPKYSNSKFSIEINVNTEVNLAEYALKNSDINEETIMILKKAAEKKLKTDIENTIRRVQQDFDSDIFSFGNSVYKNKPSLWKKISKDWNAIFKNLTVTVNPSIRIIHTGVIKKSILERE